MKPNLFLMIAVAAMVFAACSKNLYNEGSDETTSDPPTFAASNKIWTIGDQVWSDAIHIPECNKSDWDSGSYTDPQPQCHSYTDGSNTWYYYNWAYVDKHPGTLCPSTWRVPTVSDFNGLVEYISAPGLTGLWGIGKKPCVDGDCDEPADLARSYYLSFAFWSSDHGELGSSVCLVEELYEWLEVSGCGPDALLQVRCIRRSR